MEVRRKVLGGELINLGVDYNHPGAKDRRLVANHLYDQWFAANGMKLTRDYMIEFMSSSTRWGLGPTEVEVVLTIKDPTKALLFKLTWGGVL